MTLEESLNKFLSLIDDISSSIKGKDLFEEFRQIADILLNFTGTSHVSDALHVLEQNVKSMRSLVLFVEMKKSEELLTIIDYITKVELPITYGDLKTEHLEVAISLVKNAEKILTSEKEYKEFASKFEVFRENYIKTYAEEHASKNDLTKNFCKDFEKNVYFKILQEIESISEKLVGKSSGDLQDEVARYRRNACNVDGEKLREDLAGYAMCISCEHRLKGKKEVKVEITNQESGFISKVSNECMESLRDISSSLKNNESKFKELIRQKMMKEGNDLFEKLGSVETLTSKDIEEVLDLVRVLKSILKETIVVVKQAPQKPEPVHLSTIISKLRTELGKKITVRKLLEWLREKYSDEEVIEVDQ